MKFSHRWQSAAALLALSVFRALPLGAASAFGGWIGRTLGPHLARHRIASDNLQLAFPELSPSERDRILMGMWDNFGRVVGEYAHLDTLRRSVESGRGLVTFAGLEHIERLKRDYKGAVFVGGHLGNWEVGGLMLHEVGMETVAVYRPPDIPMIDRLLRKHRANVFSQLVVKRHDVKELVSALRAHGSVSMMVDQKLWQGEILPFFGHDAHTTTLPAKLALRYGVPIIPVRIERLSGPRFRITAYPPIAMPETADGDDGTNAEIQLTLAINRVLEGWIRERPEQWHWLHRRWRIREPRRKAPAPSGEQD